MVACIIVTEIQTSFPFILRGSACFKIWIVMWKIQEMVPKSWEKWNCYANYTNHCNFIFISNVCRLLFDFFFVFRRRKIWGTQRHPLGSLCLLLWPRASTYLPLSESFLSCLLVYPGVSCVLTCFSFDLDQDIAARGHIVGLIKRQLLQHVADWGQGCWCLRTSIRLFFNNFLKLTHKAN